MKSRRTAIVLALLAGLRLLAADAAPPPGSLRITLLGTGNPRPTSARSGPATLVEAGTTRILVDAGRGVAERLWSAGGREALSGIDLVALTHLHSDHLVGLPDLWLTGWIFGRKAPLRVIGPAGTAAMAAHLTEAFAFDVETRRDRDEKLPAAGAVIEARDVPPEAATEVGGVTVTAFEVDHGPVKPAYGYRVTYRGRCVVFSGDTRYSENVISHAKGCDVLVHEVLAPDVERRETKVQDPAATQRIIEHHITPEEAGRVFAAAKPRLAVYSHIVPSPATARELEGPTRKTYSGPLVVGEDLMTITVGETIEVGKAGAKER
jgi:ribonuclease Z